jgi:eukaryotic-like serine/threonine-protein kinase
MTPERWRQVTEVFHTALARTGSARVPYLDQACAGDPTLRAEVEGMLAGHAESARLSTVSVNAPTTMPQLEAGTMIGPYRIENLIGAGGMGQVYRARDTKLGRDVAVKVLPAPFISDPERLARFEREARLLAALNHPHIASIYGIEDGPAEAGHYVRALILELAEGDTLADRVAQGPIPIDQALLIARQIAEALEAAHEKGIIHRDLKPANIKITSTGVVKVLDFGLAKIYAGDSAGPDLLHAPTDTRDGMILGTAAYMSPEQARGQAVDKRTDIWAFGCVLYEMLTGRRAFAGEDVSEILAAVIRGEPDWAAVPTDTPLGVGRLLRRCLQKDRKERVHDISDARLEIQEAQGQDSQVTVLPPPVAFRRRERVAWALLAVATSALVALGVLGTLYVRPPRPEPVVTRLDVITAPTRDAFSFALSSDGRQIAFVANGEKGSQLWVRPLDQAEAQPLAGTDGASFPFWAPDGRAVGFFADGKLKRSDLSGGAIQVLADAPAPRGGTWNPDGIIVFAPTGVDPLMRVAAVGGAVTPVTQLGVGQASHRWPQFLPDGRRFLFLAALGSLQTRSVFVGSLDGGEPARVMPAETAAAYGPPGYLLLVSQGVLTAYPFDTTRATVVGEPTPVAQAVGIDDGTFHSAFSVSGSGVLAYRAGAGSKRQLVWVDRTGKMVGSIGPPDENMPAAPALAPDGQRTAVARLVQGNIDLWLMETSRNVASRITFDAAIDNSPLWSPDASQIVFRSSRKGVHDLFVKPANGTTDEQPLLVTSQGKSPLDWSRDGRFLLYSTQDPKTGSDLWVLPMMGEGKPFAIVQGSFDEIEGQFSPDGRWLAYASDESGHYEIYIRSFPEAGGKWQVSTAGGVQPRWQHDGHELFYVASDARLMAVSIHLAPDTRALEAGAPVALFPTRLAAGVNIATTGFQARAQYGVASDGRFLMNIASDEAVTSPITVALNWTAALKK